MAVTAYATGTQAATINTEHVLSAPNTLGTFTLHVDCSVLTAGDSLELRVYQMVLTGGVSRVAFYARFDGDQPVDDEIKISVPISNELTDANALQFTLKQIAGTGRSFPWKVLRYA